MIECPSIPAAVLLLLAPFGFAAADIAPNPMTGGCDLRSYTGDVTEVRMVEEDVVVRVFRDEIVTTAAFSMQNEGETVSMEVGFPYAYPGEFIEFRVSVNDRQVEARDGKKENVGRKKVTVFWKLWTMTFKGGEPCEVRVEYRTKPSENSYVFSGKNEYASLPEDVYGEMQILTRNGVVEYWLDTGKHWKGKLDRCRIAFELVGKSDENIQSYWPENGTATGDGVIWEYREFEPAGRVAMQYYPNMPVKDIPPYLCGIVARYPDDAELASDIGNSLSSRFGEKELKHEIYHSFLAKWDGRIPQLMEYASGGRCRYNFKADGQFYTTWRMAWILFDEYRKAGELERAMDIAPTVSRISGAIVDSLDTCGNLPKSNATLFEKAKELLELSNGLRDGRN